MAKIKFETGQTVNFEGDPTPEDVEEVALQLGIKKQETSEKTGLVQSLAQGLAKPFLRVGVNARNAANPSNPVDSMNFGYLGEAKRIPGPSDTLNPAQAIGVGAEIGSNIVGGGGATNIAKVGLKGLFKQGVKSGIKTGATQGGVYGLGSGLQDGESIGDVAKSTATGLGVGSVTGGLVGGVLPILGSAKNLVTNSLEKRVIKQAQNIDRLIGTITQGKVDDIPRAKKALSDLEIDGVKTYDELKDVLNTKIETITSKLDETLSTRTDTKNLSNLSVKTQVGGQEVSSNFVEDALEQLQNYYEKTNNKVEAAKISQLKKKASKEGLTIKDINDLARQHGRDLNAFNASGELASGLSKVAAENTRSGLKGTARRLFGDDIYKAADEELSNLIRTRDLVDNMTEKVNQLKQKVTERGLGERVGRLVFQVADKFTGGGLKGFIQSFIPRGEGLKVMNALDLEKALQKNLKKVQSIIDSDLPEKTVIQRLEELVGKRLPAIPEKLGNNRPIPLQNYKTIQGAMRARKANIIGRE